MADRGISPSQLARLVNVSPTAVSNWLNNGTIPRPEMQASVAKVLGVSQQHLLAGVAESTTTPRQRTVAEIINEAQREIAVISGLPIDRVRIRVEYGSD
jgi:Plasmid maintenance system antidote protein